MQSPGFPAVSISKPKEYEMKLTGLCRETVHAILDILDDKSRTSMDDKSRTSMDDKSRTSVDDKSRTSVDARPGNNIPAPACSDTWHLSPEKYPVNHVLNKCIDSFLQENYVSSKEYPNSNFSTPMMALLKDFASYWNRHSPTYFNKEICLDAILYLSTILDIKMDETKGCKYLGICRRFSFYDLVEYN